MIVNNGYLGMVRQWQDMFFEERFSQIELTHSLPDYAALARAYGALGFTAETEEELEAALVRGDRVGPHVCRRRPRRPARALLPDDPRRGGSARHGRVAGHAGGGAGRMKHTISVLLENKPGALTRITSMFARRAFNIESLAVGETERHDVSRITLRVDCDTHSLEQIEKQMHKLVNVLRVTELAPGESLERELALLKVSAPPSARAELMALGEVFNARIADLGPDSIVFELTGSPEEVDSFEELVRPHGLQELVRTGRIGLTRATRAPKGKAAQAARLIPLPSNDKELNPWQRFTATATSTFSTARSPSSASAARGMRTRSTCSDSGVDVHVGLREGSASRATAEEAGLKVGTVAEAVKGAQIVAILVPDHLQKEVWDADIAPNLEPGAAVLFAHGLNIHFERIAPPEGHDVIMVAPKAPGHRVRELYISGAGTPGLVAIQQDASGHALQLALAYGVGIGCGRVGLLETTFAEETESDLFGEQAVLCGGVPALVQAGFDTLVAGGLPAGDRLLRVPERAEADRRPALRRRLRVHALLDLRRRRVRRPLRRDASSSTTACASGCRASSTRSAAARSRRSCSRTTRRGGRASRSCASRARSVPQSSRRSARSCASSRVRKACTA